MFCLGKDDKCDIQCGYCKSYERGDCPRFCALPITYQRWRDPSKHSWLTIMMGYVLITQIKNLRPFIYRKRRHYRVKGYPL